YYSHELQFGKVNGSTESASSSNSSNNNTNQEVINTNIAGAISSTYSEYWVSGNKYRGVSGNYYTYRGRQGWNQFTGSKKYMKKALLKGKGAKNITKGLGFINYGIITYQWQEGQISNVTYGIEMTSNTISSYTPAIISIPWTIGYEGLGRQILGRTQWYQNKFKPKARKTLGID
ncbi:MAG: hypothetical protein R6U19_01690, partial [Bacteroidales bacterium]